MNKPCGQRPLPKWRPSTLTLMTFPELLRLKRALEGSEGMLVDSGIYKAVVEVLWDRGAVAVTTWPTEKHKSGLRVVHFCTDADSWVCPACKLDAFGRKHKNYWDKCHCGYVRKDKVHGPDDPKHQPVRRLHPRGSIASSQTLGDIAGGWNFEWYECSCGVRDGDASTVGQATGRTWRAAGELGGWLRSDKGKGAQLNLRDQMNRPFSLKKLVWLVCKHAQGLDDRQHAHSAAYSGALPGEGTMRAHFTCICGSSSYDDEVKQIPVEGKP